MKQSLWFLAVSVFRKLRPALLGGLTLSASLQGFAGTVSAGAQTALQFGSIAFGQTAVLPLTITNVGVTGNVTIGTSVNGPSYKVLKTNANTCLAGITAGQSCVLPVEFTPATLGIHDDILTLTPSHGAAPSTVKLRGIATGVGDEENVPLQFGTIPYGTKTILPVTITNVGHSYTVLKTSINGPSYKVVSDPESTCFSGVSAPYSCILQIEFDPAAVGEHDDILTLIPDKGPRSTISLHGAAGPAVTYSNPVKGDIYVFDGNELVEIFDEYGVYKGQFTHDDFTDHRLGNIAVDATGVYTKANGPACQIDRFDGKGNYIGQIGLCPAADFGQLGYGYLYLLSGAVSTDSRGNVWATNPVLGVQEFNASGTFLNVICTTFNASEEISNCPVVGIENVPEYITIDSNDNVYLLGESSVTKYDNTGKYLSGFFLRAGSGNGEFNDIPRGFAVDSGGDLYILDYDGNRIQVLDADGNYQRQIKFGVINGQLLRSSFGFTLDDRDNIYVTDAINGKVDIFTGQGVYLCQFKPPVPPGDTSFFLAAIAIAK
ncbi:choice-of-anchor D domain-containing protein [Acidisarcina polymorpha]|nr:choice-of-anchor D domain-containing protein [Acidisarcina polymorpha]